MNPEELKRRRKALNLTQNELAEKLGVSGNTVSRWEKGESWPDADGMLDLALQRLEQGGVVGAIFAIDQAIAALKNLRETLDA